MSTTMIEEIYTAECAVATNKTRVIFSCKRCKKFTGQKTVWAREYRACYSRMSETVTYRNGKHEYIPASYGLYRFQDGKCVEHVEDYTCPTCGADNHGYILVESNAVVGTVTDKACSGKCRGATGPVCECACGGAQHGVSHL